MSNGPFRDDGPFIGRGNIGADSQAKEIASRRYLEVLNNLLSELNAGIGRVDSLTIPIRELEPSGAVQATDKIKTDTVLSRVRDL